MSPGHKRRDPNAGRFTPKDAAAWRRLITRLALWRRLELFATPPWAARAGAELVNAIDPPPAGARWDAWEPACGLGHLAAAIAPWFGVVRATDIHDHGWGGQHFVRDFTSAEADGYEPVDWVITNPPFTLAPAFVAAGLRRARRGVAILARASLIESATRFSMMFEGPNRLYAFAPFIERVPMTLGGWNPRASTATAYAWFVWLKVRDEVGRDPEARPQIWPIGPGTKARLTRPDDARLWGVRGGAPLFNDTDTEGDC